MEKKVGISVGLMSGTSLDGLDMVACRFLKRKSDWRYEILASDCIPYSFEMKEKLKNALRISALELVELDVELGKFFGKSVQYFIEQNNLQPDLIASHGHTVFHNPLKGYSTQIGNPDWISKITSTAVYANFRQKDVCHFGNGAPYVPIGDQLLFGQYDVCLNLGGIANLSFLKDNNRIAFDVCPVGQILNELVLPLGLDYDDGGIMASQGICNPSLLQELDTLDYYSSKGPKSLGREWVEQFVFPLFEAYKLAPKDALATTISHISNQVAVAIQAAGTCSKKVLVTGGGAYNTFLVQTLRDKTSDVWYIPSNELIDYKEALIFAFMGVLRSHNQINTYASVTGAEKDLSCGVCYF